MDGMDRGTPHDGREHPTEHLGTARSRRAAIDAATRIYLDGGALDMSALAEQLGVGRTTLYRWVGNRENLLSTVLAEATVRTFRKAAADADRGGGVEHVLDVMHRFMRAVAAAPPLQALSKREHLLFIRLTMMSGPVETVIPGSSIGSCTSLSDAACRRMFSRLKSSLQAFSTFISKVA